MKTDERSVSESIVSAVATILGDGLSRAMYLVPNDEQLDALADEDIHLVREVRIDLERGGTMYFNWAEESSLNGHPFRLNVARASGCDPTADLQWVDMANDQRWRRMHGGPIRSVRLFLEQASYEADVAPSEVVTGIELSSEISYVQLSVIQAPIDYKTRSIDDPEWMPSSTVSVVFAPFDLAGRPDVRVRSIDLSSGGAI